MGLFADTWERFKGKQLAISATATFAFTMILMFSLFQLGFMQDVEGWEDFTGIAITLLVIAFIGLFITAPEFLHLKSQSNVISELLGLTSEAELRRRKAEGDEAAQELGGGHEERWNVFLEEKGLKKRR